MIITKILTTIKERVRYRIPHRASRLHKYEVEWLMNKKKYIDGSFIVAQCDFCVMKESR